MKRPLFTCAVLAGTLALFAAPAGADTPPYSQQATAACLRKAGASVTRVRRTDRRRIAVSDLAQRTSFEARLRGRSVIFAFTRGDSDADFLRELLDVPRNPYRLRVDANVVLMYRPSAAAAVSRAMRCLRA